MATRRKAAPALVLKNDPTLPTANITIHGMIYTTCLDLGTLIDAEEYFLAQGHKPSLLESLDGVTATKVRVLFALGARRFHPELGFEGAKNLISSDVQAMFAACALIPRIWELSMPKPKEGAANPPVAAPVPLG